MLLGHLVQAGGVGIEQGGHLVDERARATGAGAVHALLDAAIEVDDLRILAAELDGNVGGGDNAFDGRLVGDDLLHEGHAKPIGQQQTARARNGDSRLAIAHCLECLVDDLDDGRANIGMVATVHAEDDFVVRVEHEQLDRRRAYVNANPERVLLAVLGTHMRLLRRMDD